ncbi:MAG TPA: pyridoxamine 5'-phosphate oxidase family protein [Chloroflexota bacterium]|nr:pyridoxamine 5'-phosphate oxidase family protein [Chloroflexota bacterium]
MFDEQMRSVLAQPVIVRLTTIRPDGYPHTVPVWFMLDGEELVLFSVRDNRKVKNALANLKGCISIGGDPVGSPCYLIDGDLAVADDPDHNIATRITRHYESPEKAQEYLQEWQDADFVVLRLKPKRVVKVS